METKIQEMISVYEMHTAVVDELNEGDTIETRYCDIYTGSRRKFIKMLISFLKDHIMTTETLLKLLEQATGKTWSFTVVSKGRLNVHDSEYDVRYGLVAEGENPIVLCSDIEFIGNKEIIGSDAIDSKLKDITDKKIAKLSKTMNWTVWYLFNREKLFRDEIGTNVLISNQEYDQEELIFKVFEDNFNKEDVHTV